jgi:hypothetical protein
MKKHILSILILTAISANAHAADSFTRQRDVNAKREEETAGKIQREVEQINYAKQNLQELQRSNKLNAEISAKLDKLIESSDANNALMETLLKRTE